MASYVGMYALLEIAIARLETWVRSSNDVNAL